MLFLPTKFYQTKKKIESIFFLHPDKIKLVIAMVKGEFENEIYLNNVKKSCEVLSLNYDTEVKVIGISPDENFNWSGLNQFHGLKIIFMGEVIKPFAASVLHDIFEFESKKVAVTYSMSEIVKDQSKKGIYWNLFKQLILS